MKIKVKDTGEILNLAPDSYICGLRNGQEVEFTADEIELVPDKPTRHGPEWDSFRREAAKDILCAIIGKINTHVYDITDINKERYCIEAVIWANELISILSNHD